MQQIIVTIDAEGSVKVEAAGVRGAGCQQLTAAVEKALGSSTGDTKKNEFFQHGQACALPQQAQQDAK